MTVIWGGGEGEGGKTLECNYEHGLVLRVLGAMLVVLCDAMVTILPTQSIVIHTAVLVNAVHLATLINGYCMMYTTLSHSRITGGVAFVM